MVKQTFRVFLLVALIGAMPLLADLVPVGPPLPYESWVQSWSLSSSGPFNRLVAKMLTTGVTFASPGFLDVATDLPDPYPTDFTSPWTATNDLMIAQVSKSGSPVSNLDYYLHYSPEEPGLTAFQYKLTVYNDSTVVESYLSTWDTKKWTVTTTVPEASTVVLRGGWLLGLGLLIVRRKALGRRGAA
jgi:hypothetical protein